jgi:hypothetical protein
MAETTCPYCNTIVAIPESSGGRLTCPRCGDSFAVCADPTEGTSTTEKPSDTGTPSGGDLASNAAADPLPHRPGPGLSNGFILSIIVGVMLFMALAALCLAMDTAGVRFNNHYRLPKSQVVVVPLVVAVAANLWVLGLLVVALDLLPGQHTRPHALSLGRRWMIASVSGTLLVAASMAMLSRPLKQRSSLVPPTDPNRTARGSGPPAEWDVLRCLPADVDAILGIDFTEAASDSLARDLLEGTWGKQLERWIGLRGKEVSRLAVGAKVELPPRLTLVTEPHDAIEPHRLLETLNAKSQPEPGTTDRFRFRMDRLGLEGIVVVSGDGRRVQVGFPATDFKALTTEPFPSPAFSEKLRDLLNERVERAGVAWLVARADCLTDLLRLVPNDVLDDEDRQALTQVRWLALSLAGEGRTRLEAECVDSASAEAVESLLLRFKPEDVEARLVRKDAWISGQIRLTADVLARWIPLGKRE